MVKRRMQKAGRFVETEIIVPKTRVLSNHQLLLLKEGPQSKGARPTAAESLPIFPPPNCSSYIQVTPCKLSKSDADTHFKDARRAWQQEEKIEDTLSTLTTFLALFI